MQIKVEEVNEDHLFTDPANRSYFARRLREEDEKFLQNVGRPYGVLPPPDSRKRCRRDEAKFLEANRLKFFQVYADAINSGSATILEEVLNRWCRPDVHYREQYTHNVSDTLIFREIESSRLLFQYLSMLQRAIPDCAMTDYQQTLKTRRDGSAYAMAKFRFVGNFTFNILMTNATYHVRQFLTHANPLKSVLDEDHLLNRIAFRQASPMFNMPSAFVSAYPAVFHPVPMQLTSSRTLVSYAASHPISSSYSADDFDLSDAENEEFMRLLLEHIADTQVEEVRIPDALSHYPVNPVVQQLYLLDDKQFMSRERETEEDGLGMFEDVFQALVEPETNSSASVDDFGGAVGKRQRRITETDVQLAVESIWSEQSASWMQPEARPLPCGAGKAVVEVNQQIKSFQNTCSISSDNLCSSERFREKQNEQLSISHSHLLNTEAQCSPTHSLSCSSTSSSQSFPPSPVELSIPEYAPMNISLSDSSRDDGTGDGSAETVHLSQTKVCSPHENLLNIHHISSSSSPVNSKSLSRSGSSSTAPSPTAPPPIASMVKVSTPFTQFFVLEPFPKPIVVDVTLSYIAYFEAGSDLVHRLDVYKKDEIKRC